MKPESEIHMVEVRPSGVQYSEPRIGIKNWVRVHKYALEKLYFFGIIKYEPKLDGVASFNYGVPMATFQLHHQTLITIEYQSIRQDESNESKLDGLRRLITEFLWPLAPSSD
ncbi:hypothetical protein EVAR_47290_1 [Eumeta japonica]|uniref:Uncharacterized protein n=1 Tax=Eumeta variegata TaxID=151549 RepID=A0A4C1Z187_EUMVA|nr:hypothetical protein EVAR_47290_1 [Eumeta japonica]